MKKNFYLDMMCEGARKELIESREMLENHVRGRIDKQTIVKISYYKGDLIYASFEIEFSKSVDNGKNYKTISCEEAHELFREAKNIWY